MKIIPLSFVNDYTGSVLIVGHLLPELVAVSVKFRVMLFPVGAFPLDVRVFIL